MILILTNTVGKSQYLPWWCLADNIRQLQTKFDIMARLVCHTSLLRDDDPRLKKGSSIQKCVTNVISE